MKLASRDIEPFAYFEAAYLGKIAFVFFAFVIIVVDGIARLLWRGRGRGQGQNPLHGRELVVAFTFVIIAAGEINHLLYRCRGLPRGRDIVAVRIKDFSFL